MTVDCDCDCIIINIGTCVVIDILKVHLKLLINFVNWFLYLVPGYIHVSYIPCGIIIY